VRSGMTRLCLPCIRWTCRRITTFCSLRLALITLLALITMTVSILISIPVLISPTLTIALGPIAILSVAIVSTRISVILSALLIIALTTSLLTLLGAAFLITSPLSTTTTSIPVGSSHDQAPNLIGVLHAYQIAIGWETVVDIEVVTISEVIIVVLNFGWSVWQRLVTDVVHFFAVFTWRAKRAIARTNTVSDIIVLLA